MDASKLAVRHFTKSCSYALNVPFLGKLLAKDIKFSVREYFTLFGC